jgi:hypothetical protein
MQEDADEDEEYTPSFLPLSREDDQTPRDRPGEELSATLRLNAERAAAARRQMAERAGHRHPVATESSTSSMSSGAPASLTNSDSRRLGQPASALSPHRAGEAPRQSPRKSTTSGREASDGTPSMGSSFSDLDGELGALKMIVLSLLTGRSIRRQRYTVCLGGGSYEQYAAWRDG